MILSNDQEKASTAFVKWFQEVSNDDAKLASAPFFYIGGWAGTGKTTLARYLIEKLEVHSVAYAAYTGKAALQMHKSGCFGAQTIHSLIYRPVNQDDEFKLTANSKDRSSNQEPSFELDPDSTLRYRSLAVLDECSMVDENVGSDFISFRIPTLVLGDPGQLPAIKGAGYFTTRRPDAVLNEVHRQALESPIIRVATDIRNGRSLRRFTDGQVRIYPRSSEWDGQDILDHEQVLCGTNRVRIASNNRIRELTGHTGIYPQVGDRIICLRNNQRERLFNGLIGNVSKVNACDNYEVDFDFVTEDGEKYKDIRTHELCWSNPDELKNISYREKTELNEFTFGSCITVHKAQGSEWDSVCVLDDGFLEWKPADRKRWLYTAVTRAENKLTLIRS